jgi:hypothetical protein
MSLAVVRLRFRRMVGGRIVALTAPPASIHLFEWSAWKKKVKILELIHSRSYGHADT